MSTGIEQFRPAYRVPWGYTDMRDYVIGAGRSIQESELYAQFGGAPLLVDAIAALSTVGAPDHAVSVTNDDLRAVVPRAALAMRLLRYGASALLGGGALFVETPYEGSAVIAYQVGLRWTEVPTESRLSDAGAYELVRWREAIGERDVPMDVVDPGDGTIRIVLFRTGELSTTVARGWPSTNGGSRYVTAWLATPAAGHVDGVGNGIYSGNVVADAEGTISLVVPHTFGQDEAAISTDPADYQVVVHGMSIWRESDRNLATYEALDGDGNAFRPYAVLGHVLNGAVTYELAASTPSLASNALDLQQLAKDVITDPYTFDHDGLANLAQPVKTEARQNALQVARDAFDAADEEGTPYTIDNDGVANLTAPLQQLIRMLRRDLHDAGRYMRAPAVLLGTITETRAWWYGYGTASAGGVTTFTWPALPSPSWFLTRDENGRTRWVDTLASLAVDFDEENIDGAYIIYIEAEESGTDPGAEATRGRIKVDSVASGLPNGKLQLLQFLWVAPDVTSPQQIDPVRSYRPRPNNNPDASLRSGDAVAIRSLDLNGDSKPRLRLFMADASTDPETVDALEVVAAEDILEDAGATTVRQWTVSGPGGAADDLPDFATGGALIRALLGGSRDWYVAIHGDRIGIFDRATDDWFVSFYKGIGITLQDGVFSAPFGSFKARGRTAVVSPDATERLVGSVRIVELILGTGLTSPQTLARPHSLTNFDHANARCFGNIAASDRDDVFCRVTAIDATNVTVKIYSADGTNLPDNYNVTLDVLVHAPASVPAP